MFWRRDEFVAEAARHPHWALFHRACGRAGLYFDDIDPVGDDFKDVTRRPRRGYTAVSHRVDEHSEYVVATGKGESPIAAVIDTYRNSIAAGFPVQAGLEVLFDKDCRLPDDLRPIVEAAWFSMASAAATLPPCLAAAAKAPTIDDDLMELIG